MRWEKMMQTEPEIEVHNQIMDKVTNSIHRHFLTHGTLYADRALLDPRNFSQVSALQEPSKCLLKFDGRATVANLQCELRNLDVQ